ncbi:MAG: V-type ATP synthase subunit E [Huintestinicola sp.]
MEQDQKKLDRFISAVNSETDKRVNEILAEAESEKERILSEAAKAAEEARDRHIGDSKKMSAGKYVRMVSKAELDMKKEVLVCREKLTAELFANVEKKIAEFKDTDSYTALIIKQLSAEELDEGAVICVSPEDIKYADIIRKAINKGSIEINPDNSIRLGGFFILRRNPDGSGTITDKTFDCIIREQRSLFSSRNVMTAEN